MNCHDFNTILPEFLQLSAQPADPRNGQWAPVEIAGERGEAQRTALCDFEAARAHLETCPRCAEKLANEIRLSSSLNSLGRIPEENRAAERIEAILLKAFRAAHATTSDSQSPAAARISAGDSRRAAFWGLLGRRTAWALAALLLVAMGATVGERLLRKPQLPRVSQTHSVAPALAIRLPEKASSRSAAPSLPLRAANKILTVSSHEFYPLPYGSGLSLNEGWAIVRVEMPVSALEPLGVPVASGGSQYVLADVVVADDGTPRAIRLVR